VLTCTSASRTCFTSRTGAACLGAGCQLQLFMKQLAGAWEAGGDDVAV
jgi:hypothetical protein